MNQADQEGGLPASNAVQFAVFYVVTDEETDGRTKVEYRATIYIQREYENIGDSLTAEATAKEQLRLDFDKEAKVKDNELFSRLVGYLIKHGHEEKYGKNGSHHSIDPCSYGCCFIFYKRNFGYARNYSVSWSGRTCFDLFC